MVCSCAGLQQGALVEENIDVERFASMPLVSDFLGVLHRTWGQWSLPSRFVLKRLSSKKHLPDISAVQSSSAEDSRNVEMQAPRTTQARNQPTANTKSPNSFFPDEVSLHSSPNDCWIVIKDKVYDVSKFGQEHPGGSVIYTHGGRDATDIFATFHAPSTWKLLQQFYIGDQRSVEPTPELLKDYRELRAVFLRTRLFKSSKSYYAFKCLTNAALLAASIIVISLSQSLQSVLLSAFLLGLCYQQCGWLSHDFLHHQVFETRWLNNVFGYLIGNVVLGFSTSWWKNKHNLHHAAPNECDQTYKPIDEDIDTLPLLAWSKDILDTVDSKMMKSILQWQHVFFFPILMFARFSWLLYSWLYCNRADMPLNTKVLEKGTMLVHYCWFIGTAFWFLPSSMALTWLLVTELITGTLLGLVFVLSHNGMEVYNSSKDFVNAQVASTRDIKANMFNNWFTGGLNRQIEHHLFPTMPRHNLNKISSHVQALCEKHGLVYEDIDIALGTYRVVETLAEVAAAAAAS